MTVELKNDLAIKGTLHSVDQYLNIKLNNIRVVSEQKYPHLVRTKTPIICTARAALAVRRLPVQSSRPVKLHLCVRCAFALCIAWLPFETSDGII